MTYWITNQKHSHIGAGTGEGGSSWGLGGDASTTVSPNSEGVTLYIFVSFLSVKNNWTKTGDKTRFGVT